MQTSIAKIDLGFMVVEGLMSADGSYGMAVPQVADLFETHRNTASRDFKRILGEGFETSKVKSEFNQGVTLFVRINVVSKLAVMLSAKGNKAATAFLLAAAEETIERRFDSAFNVVRTEDERTARMKARYDAAKSFHPHFTQWLLKDAGGDRTAVNCCAEVNQLKVTLGLPLVNVDSYDEDQLRRLKDCEVMYHGMRIGGLNHETAMTCLRAV